MLMVDVSGVISIFLSVSSEGLIDEWVVGAFGEHLCKTGIDTLFIELLAELETFV